MTHYRLSDSMPSAIILSRNQRNSSLDELKTYQGTDIFLKHGDEFQIKLFNPLQIKIGASISINGKSSNDLIVLNPGEDIIIDRFVNDKRKMIFETYQYDDSNPQAKKAIENNGLIEIKFFKEFFQNDFFPSYGTIIYEYNPIFVSPSIPHYYSGNTTTNFNSEYSTNTITSGQSSLDNQKEVKSTKKETGIISKGSESNQDFYSVNVQFESFPFHTVFYKLKPISEKKSYKVEVRDYCTSCGYRLRNDKWLYCPKCGNKI